jgi:hypothetical protein
MPDRDDTADAKALDGTLEAFQRFTDLEGDLAPLGADWEAEREVTAIGDETSRGWVVVAIDRLLNGRPSVRHVFGPSPRSRTPAGTARRSRRTARASSWWA